MQRTINNLQKMRISGHQSAYLLYYMAGSHTFVDAANGSTFDMCHVYSNLSFLFRAVYLLGDRVPSEGLTTKLL